MQVGGERGDLAARVYAAHLELALNHEDLPEALACLSQLREIAPAEPLYRELEQVHAAVHGRPAEGALAAALRQGNFARFRRLAEASPPLAG